MCGLWGTCAPTVRTEMPFLCLSWSEDSQLVLEVCLQWTGGIVLGLTNKKSRSNLMGKSPREA